jgi:hypothetical protein
VRYGDFVASRVGSPTVSAMAFGLFLWCVRFHDMIGFFLLRLGSEEHPQKLHNGSLLLGERVVHKHVRFHDCDNELIIIGDDRARVEPFEQCLHALGCDFQTVRHRLKSLSNG